MNFPNLLIVIALLVVSPIVAAQTPEQADVLRASMAEIQQRLNLTEEQQALVEPIMKNHLQETSAVLQKYGVEPGSSGPGNIRKMRKMRGELEPIREQTNDALSDVLNAQQMAEYEKIQEERKEAMRDRIRTSR